jgi:hypothetical protein
VHIQREQLRAIYAMLKQAGYSFDTRAERIQWLNGYRFALGMPTIKSFNDMTAQEAAHLQRDLFSTLNPRGA